MSAPDKNTALLEPPLKRRPARSPRHLLIGLTAFAATVAVFYAEENWRGRRAWEAWQHEAAARGVVLDRSAQFPPMPPDEQNLFKAPNMREWFVGRNKSSFSARLDNAYAAVTSAKWITNVVAEVEIVPPGTGAAAADTRLRMDLNEASSREKAAQILQDHLGRAGFSSRDALLFVAAPVPASPVGVFLEAGRPPDEQRLAELFDGPPGRAGILAVRRVATNRFQVLMSGGVRAADFLTATEALEPDFQAMREALQRPFARLPGGYDHLWDGEPPNFVVLRSAAQVLTDRAEAWLVARQPEAALRDLTLLYQLRRWLGGASMEQPLALVEAMVNVAVTGLYTSEVAEGFRLQVWQEPQLAVLQRQLSELNLVRLVANSLVDEREGVRRMLEGLPMGELGKSVHLDPGPAGVFTLLPRGWVYQNLRVYAETMQLQIDGIDSASATIGPRRCEAGTWAIENLFKRWSPYSYLAGIGIPNTAKAALTLARNQTSANQAAIVCALERFRLAQGEYPETLQALAPRFMSEIPHDPIGGQIPHYRRVPGGTFELYSIGWSEKDHGGHAAQDEKQGDWVWNAAKYR